MPLKSKAQERWMWSQHPEMAKMWEEHTPDRASLPEHADDLGTTPIMMDGLEKLQKAFVYSRQKQAQESAYVQSLRPEKPQSTLNEYGVKGTKYVEK